MTVMPNRAPQSMPPLIKKDVDLIVSAPWILPVVPANKLFQNCSLVVKDSRILAIEPSLRIEERYQAKETVVLTSHCLMPGLINLHGHAAMTLLRGYADDLPLERWLSEKIWPAEAAKVSADFVRAGTELAIAEMLASGTTCFSDMYFFPDAAADAALRAGMRAQVFFPVFDFPSSWGKDADEYISKGLALNDEHRSSSLIGVGFGPHAPYTVADKALERIAVLSEEMQALVHIHLHETAQEVNDAVAKDGRRPIQRLAELGLLSPRMHAVHMTQASNDDIAMLAEHGAHMVHCPSSNLKLASGFARAAAIAAAGVNIALGTDGAASCNHLDLFSEMRLAALLAKGVSGDASALPAQQALECATINAARALGRDDDLGSLSAGKLADVIAVQLDGLGQQPGLQEPGAQAANDSSATRQRLLSHLVYTHSGSQVSHSWIGGRCVLDEGHLQNGIYERAKDALRFAAR